MKEILLKDNATVAFVDDDDYEFLAEDNWHAKKYGERGGLCAARYTPRPEHKVIYMHRFLLGLYDRQGPTRVEVKHRNGNTFDNRRENLLVQTTSETQQMRGKQRNNKTGYKGVFENPNGGYDARIGYQKKEHYLGHFKSKEDAARCYNEGAKKYFGDRAVLNMLPDETSGEIGNNDAQPAFTKSVI